MPAGCDVCSNLVLVYGKLLEYETGKKNGRKREGEEFQASAFQTWFHSNDLNVLKVLK